MYNHAFKPQSSLQAKYVEIIGQFLFFPYKFSYIYMHACHIFKRKKLSAYVTRLHIPLYTYMVGYS